MKSRRAVHGHPRKSRHPDHGQARTPELRLAFKASSPFATGARAGTSNNELLRSD
jgi:hypothetical protein